MPGSPRRYPYYLHDLGDDEKDLIRQIIRAGLALDLFSMQHLVNRAGGRQLRYLLNGNSAQTPKSNRAETAFSNWVFLFNYCTGELYDIVKARVKYSPSEFGEINHLIERLDDAASQSGRYDNDMHIFNRDIILTETSELSIDQSFLDLYVSLRSSSDGDQLVVAATRIRIERGRHIFNALVLAGANERESRGFVYSLGGRLYLYGFLGEDHGGETFALQPNDGQTDLLFGVMTTVNSVGQPHAKRCVFVRASLIYGLDELDLTTVLSPLHSDDRLRRDTNLAALKQALQYAISEDRKVLFRAGGEPLIQLEQYIDSVVIEPKNKRPASPANPGPPY